MLNAAGNITNADDEPEIEKKKKWGRQMMLKKTKVTNRWKVDTDTKEVIEAMLYTLPMYFRGY